MATLRTEERSRLFTRTCLTCGYAGPELQGPRGDLVFRCPKCDQDLYARPPKSYAQMEGLEAEALDSHTPQPAPAERSLLRPLSNLLRRLASVLRRSRSLGR